MDYSSKPKTRVKRNRFSTLNKNACDTEESYRYSSQFYRVPPLDTISLSEFEQFAVDRLTVLRTFETANFKYPKSNKNYGDYILKELRRLSLMGFVYKTVSLSELTPEMYADRRRDHISHYILRLAYCRSEDLRKWFLKHEVDLFQYRFSEEGKATQEVLAHNGLSYEPIDVDEDLRRILLSTLPKSAAISHGAMMYFTVPFHEVLDLVAVRKVYLKDGNAYVAQNDLSSIIGNVYRTQLSQALAVTARLLPQMEEDDRLLSMLKNMNDRYLGEDYGKTSKVGSGEVNPAMVDPLSKTSFPMCMRVMHESLREKHHLKHHARLVYGLFLKGIGLSLEDAQRFFREAFLKSMDSETYEKKKYDYNIRYNYGAEGKKTNLTPYSCSAIITKNAPGPGESHGCPFKTFDKNLLSQRLQAMQISRQGINEIMDLTSKGHYQLACTRQFELTHGGATLQQAINHPNYYYEESRKLHQANAGTSMEVKDRVKPPTQRSVVLPSQSTCISESVCSENASSGVMDSLSQEDIDTLSQLASEDF